MPLDDADEFRAANRRSGPDVEGREHSRAGNDYPISFFYSHGRPNGKLYEELEQLQRVVNKQFKTGNLKVRISYIPMRPDELGPALSQGVGDFIAADVVITPGRQKLYAFTTLFFGQKCVEKSLDRIGAFVPCAILVAIEFFVTFIESHTSIPTLT